MLGFGHLQAICLSLVLGVAVEAATYHVAQQNPAANDNAAGTSERPWKTITNGVSKVAAGDVVVIHGGIYRERVAVKNSGTAQAPIRFEAAPGEHVVVTGADRIRTWRKADDGKPIYSAAWPYKFIQWNRTMTHPADEYHQIIGRCEQVMVDDYLLRQVLSKAQLAPGTFFADITNKTLLVWDIGNRDLNKAEVVASVRQEVLRVDGDHVQVRGVRFRYAANMAQHGAVILAGRHNTLEDCMVEDMNADGAAFNGEDAVVRRVVLRNNGLSGFGAGRAHRLLFTECLVENNNTKGFDRGWYAGGNKLAFCRDAVLEKSRFVRNRGNGIWFDIGNTNCTVRQCLIAENEDAGIFYEISFSLHAHDNVIVGNGFAQNAGAWGAQAGISLSSSPWCMIERNLIVGNREGFNFREQLRNTPTIEGGTHAVWNHDQVIRNNLIVFNREAQVWGWFDVKDDRHWPAGTMVGHGANTTNKPGDIAGAYGAKTSEGQPQGLTLKDLQLRFEKNVYYAAPGRGWFNWGPTWRRHKSYPELGSFQAELGIDSGSVALDPGFADMRQMDFRASAERMEQLKACYPRGPVPGVTLGIR